MSSVDSNTIAQMNDATYSSVIFPAPAEETTLDLEVKDDLDTNYGELIDYNEVDELAVRSPETNRKLLRDALAENGFALRKVLLSEPIVNHYASPLAMEKMSVEDIMSESPTEDLLQVGTIKDRIFMPASFPQKWILPTIKVQKALKLHATAKCSSGFPPFAGSYFA
jgi:hypothetical protein